MCIRDSNRGIPVNHNEDYTVAEWCRLWSETYSKPVIRPNTAKTYENVIENHIVPAIGVVKLKPVSYTHLLPRTTRSFKSPKLPPALASVTIEDVWNGWMMREWSISATA